MGISHEESTLQPCKVLLLRSMDREARRRWRQVEVAPLEAAGYRVVVVRLIPWPPRSGVDVDFILEGGGDMPAGLYERIHEQPYYREKAAVLVGMERDYDLPSSLVRPAGLPEPTVRLDLGLPSVH